MKPIFPLPTPMSSTDEGRNVIRNWTNVRMCSYVLVGIAITSRLSRKFGSGLLVAAHRPASDPPATSAVLPA